MSANSLWIYSVIDFNVFVSSAVETVQNYMKANETLSSFLLTNTTLSPVTVDQLMKARLNFQVRDRL